MMQPPEDIVRWPDEIDEIIHGDLTVAAAYVTPAGGAVVTSVAPCGLRDRDKGMVGYTTSLGFGKKLERILREPRVALAYHTRLHGLSARRRFILVQGIADVDITPDRDRLEGFVPQAERFMGRVVRGRFWDRWLQEYYRDRVFVDITVRRIVAWSNLHGEAEPEIFGEPPAAPADPQAPPRGGTEARVDVHRVARRLAALPHQVIAFTGADGYPVVAPVEMQAADGAALYLSVSPGLLPPGGRRAGLLAHRFNAQLLGLATRLYTGWLEVDDGRRAIYRPHTEKGFTAPSNKTLLLLSNGLLAKVGLWQARRKGTADQLQRLGDARKRSSLPRPKTIS